MSSILGFTGCYNIYKFSSKYTVMAIAISLTPELEARLLEKATQQGKDISLVAAELLKNILDWELEDSQAAIQGIQQGLDDFEAGRFRSFDDFAKKSTF
jgi:predicted transcriptional regulator